METPGQWLADRLEKRPEIRYRSRMEIAALKLQLLHLKPLLLSEGVQHVSLFGSRARGDYNGKSDIDLLIDAAPDRSFSLLNLIGVEHIVGDATGLTANAVMRRSIEPSFKKSIENDIVDIF